MKSNCNGGWKMKLANVMFGMTLLMMLSRMTVWAQTSPAGESPNPFPIQTFYLTNVSQPKDAGELTTALRNLLDPHDKIYLVESENAVVVQGPPEQIALARTLLNDLDRPKKTYRLTYTITDTDGGNRVGTQRFAMIVVAGQRTTLKQGNKVPIETGTHGGGNDVKTEMTYVDVGMNFDATLDEFANGVRLNSKVEQLSVADEKSGAGAQDPIIRQTQIQGTSFLTAGKPLILGSLDIPGSTRHVDIEVVMDLVK
jgi:type II secretory pathway component GspD/PulD (secretin)